MTVSRDAFGAARERHRERSRGRRAAALAGGWAAAALGLALVVPAPEAGLPLLVVGLRLLALRYDWAARMYLPVARLWEWVRSLPRLAKLAVGVAAATVVVAVAWSVY